VESWWKDVNYGEWGGGGGGGVFFGNLELGSVGMKWTNLAHLCSVMGVCILQLKVIRTLTWVKSQISKMLELDANPHEQHSGWSATVNWSFISDFFLQFGLKFSSFVTGYISYNVLKRDTHNWVAFVCWLVRLYRQCCHSVHNEVLLDWYCCLVGAWSVGFLTSTLSVSFPYDCGSPIWFMVVMWNVALCRTSVLDRYKLF